MQEKGRKKKHGFCYKRVCILKEPHFAKFSQESEINPTLHKHSGGEEEEHFCLSLFQGCRGVEWMLTSLTQNQAQSHQWCFLKREERE
jgi:hypothetical protein